MENLTLEEIRLVADLRLLHSAANNLLGIIGQIKTRHSQPKIEELADPIALLVTVREVQGGSCLVDGVETAWTSCVTLSRRATVCESACELTVQSACRRWGSTDDTDRVREIADKIKALRVMA
jgi:hypothetical protein